MNLSTLARGERWMTPAEKRLNRRFVTRVARQLRARGVADSPMLCLRIGDVAVTWILARRLEAALSPDPAAPSPAAATPAQADAVGKNRERLRKAIKELEEFCERNGAPVETGLADIVRPMLRKVEGAGLFTPGP